MITLDEVIVKYMELTEIVDNLKEQISYLETRIDEVTPTTSIRPDNTPERPKEVT